MYTEVEKNSRINTKKTQNTTHTVQIKSQPLRKPQHVNNIFVTNSNFL